jgi:Cys-rich radical ribosomally synthesized peptide
MITYDDGSYSAMFGEIEQNHHLVGDRCISQCTGCMCTCRCSCSGGYQSDLEWEVL